MPAGLLPGASQSAPPEIRKISSPAAGILSQVPGQQLKLTATPDGAPRFSCPPGDIGRGSEVKYCDFHFGAFCFRGEISGRKIFRAKSFSCSKTSQAKNQPHG